MHSRRTELGCPRCRLPLFEGQSNDYTLLACGACGGVWLDQAACQKLLVEYPVDAVLLSGAAAAHPTVLAVALGPASCPQCSQTMVRSRVPMARVEVESCAAHGTWFDRGELREVVDAIHHRLVEEVRRARSGAETMAATPHSQVPSADEIAAAVQRKEREWKAAHALIPDVVDFPRK